jgi:hypothetical protein
MFSVLWNVHISSYAQAQLVAKPFTGFVNQAIAGTIVKYAVRRGFAANDPRIAVTMQAVGKVIDVGVNGGAILDTALVVAGAPVWGTVALGLATAGVVAFGAYQIYKTMSTDPNTGASIQTVKVVDTSKSQAAQTADPVALTKADFVSPNTAPKVSTTPVSGGKLSLVHYRNPSCDATVNSSCAAYPVSPPSRYFLQMTTTDGFPFNTASDFLYIRYILTCGADAGCSSEWAVAPTIDASGVISGTYKITYMTKDANGNPTGNYASTGSSMSASPRTDAGALGAYYGNNLGDLFDQLTATAHNASMTPDAMADIVSQAIIKASSDPAYQGLPYSVTNPVTGADVSAWQAEGAGRALTMTGFEAAVEPAGATSVTIAPSVTAANPYAVDTSVLTPPSNVNVINTPNVSVVNKVSVDFGADPGIAEPQLEPTPTATQIFKPVMDSVQSLAVYTVPSHPSECPKPKFDIFGKSILMDAHCTLLDSVKPTLFAVMAVVWVVVGILIILAA